MAQTTRDPLISHPFAHETPTQPDLSKISPSYLPSNGDYTQKKPTLEYKLPDTLIGKDG